MGLSLSQRRRTMELEVIRSRDIRVETDWTDITCNIRCGCLGGSGRVKGSWIFSLIKSEMRGGSNRNPSPLNRAVSSVFSFVRYAEFEILFVLFFVIAFIIFKDLVRLSVLRVFHFNLIQFCLLFIVVTLLLSSISGVDLVLCLMFHFLNPVLSIKHREYDGKPAYSYVIWWSKVAKCHFGWKLTVKFKFWNGVSVLDLWMVMLFRRAFGGVTRKYQDAWEFPWELESGLRLVAKSFNLLSKFGALRIWCLKYLPKKERTKNLVFESFLGLDWSLDFLAS